VARSIPAANLDIGRKRRVGVPFGIHSNRKARPEKESSVMPQRYDINTVREYAKACTNWGKWGPEDEFGTLNYITPEKIRDAARLVKDGRVISLSTEFNSDGPQKQSGRSQRFNPIHLMFRNGADALVGAQAHRPLHSSDDVIIMPLQCATQWDSLAHIFFEGKMYNGYDISLVSSFGAARNSIDKCKNKIVSRGVLLDIPALKGKKWLEPGEAIFPDDLTRCAEKQGVKVGTGDIILIRTGQMRQAKEQGWGDYAGGSAPGLSVTTAPWIHERQVAGVATDTWGIEVLPNETEGVFQPLHIILIVHAGLLVGEIFDLEELAADCERDGRYEFLFVAPPLLITGAVGSPINPQAIK
jgi:kynurenine formamidase